MIEYVIFVIKGMNISKVRNIKKEENNKFYT